MNIFLDTNILYKDPFFQRGKLVVLRELAKASNVKIFISKAVLAEVRSGYKTYIENNLKAFNKSILQLNNYIVNPLEKINFNLKLNYFLNEFDSKIASYQRDNTIKVVDYEIGIIDRLVNLDMSPMEPFYKTRNFNNKVVNDNKSIRDAIIWYSYIDFIKKNELKNCYFLSNNTKDFAQDHKKAQSKLEKSYGVHENLITSSFISAHKSVADFIQTYETKIQGIFSENGIDILIEEVIRNISKAMKSQETTMLLSKLISDSVEEEIISDIASLEPPTPHGYSFTGYVDDDGYEGGYYEDIKIQEVSSYGNILLVDLYFKYSKYVDVYANNPMRIKGEDRHVYIGQEEIVYEMTCVISWELRNYIAALDNTNLDLKKVINLNHPSNIEYSILDKKYEGHLENPDEYDDGYDLIYGY